MTQEDNNRRWRRGAPWVFLIVVALASGTLFVAMGGLSEEVRKDERFFWPAAQHFAQHWIPTFADLRTYPAPETPLCFLVYGALEHATGRGLLLGRVLNTALALAVVVLIAGSATQGWPRRALAACGLLACPYFLGSSLYLYTDGPATALVVLGLAAYLGGRHALSGIVMALAVACRQYMVAFPAAILAWELWKVLRPSRDRHAGSNRVSACISQALSAATLLGWIWIFGGLAPPGAVEQFRVATADPARFLPRNGLYFLTCVGAYFVVVEMALFRTPRVFRELLSVRGAVLAVLLGVGFFLFPPIENIDYDIPSMGYLDKAARAVLPDLPRMLVFWGLAVLAAVRFGRVGLAGLLVAANAVVLTKAHIGWDKYAVPVLAALWLLRSLDVLDEPVTPAAGTVSSLHQTPRAP